MCKSLKVLIVLSLHSNTHQAFPSRLTRQTLSAGPVLMVNLLVVLSQVVQCTTVLRGLILWNINLANLHSQHEPPRIQRDALRGECKVIYHRNLDLNFELYVMCVNSPYFSIAQTSYQEAYKTSYTVSKDKRHANDVGIWHGNLETCFDVT